MLRSKELADTQRLRIAARLDCLLAVGIDPTDFRTPGPCACSSRSLRKVAGSPCAYTELETLAQTVMFAASWALKYPKV